MRNDSHTHRSRRFLPAGMDTLEQRVVLSAGMATRAAMVSTAQATGNQSGNNGGSQNQQTPLMTQVIDQINQQFASFATQYYQLQGAYFASFASPPGTGAIDLTTFHNQAGTLVDNLSKQVLGVIDAVPGGGGLLDGFIQQRLDSGQPGSLRYQLTNMPAVGTSGLDQTGFGLTASAILQDALLYTQNTTNLYNQSLLFTTLGFFNGTFRFFNKDLFAANLPQTTPGSPAATQQVVNDVNRFFSTFAQDYRNALSTYFGTIGSTTFGPNGDIQTFRTVIGQSLTNLETDTLNAVEAASGGTEPLSAMLTAQLGGNLPGSFRYELLNLPPVGTSGLSPAGFALTADTYLSDALVSTQNSIGLFDASLNFVAEGFFNEFAPRFFRSRPTGNTGNRLSTRRADPSSGQVQDAQAIVSANPFFFPFGFNNTFFGVGNGLNPIGFFNFAPEAFNANLGFGGLGNGFNFANSQGTPFGNSIFGTGFSFGTAGGFNVNSGFNPLMGVNPIFGNGFGSSFGVIGPSFGPGFSQVDTSGISGVDTSGIDGGVTSGLGGFFF